MNSYVFYTALVVAFLAFIENGDALQCWECNSDQYGRCADLFNTTQFPRTSMIFNVQNNYPRLTNCDSPSPQGGYGNYGYQRQACMKRVEVDRKYGRTTYTRGCHIMTGEDRIGTCANRNSYGDVSIDFCEYCDTHECNGAQGLQKNAFWIGLIPIALALMLRK